MKVGGIQVEYGGIGGGGRQSRIGAAGSHAGASPPPPTVVKLSQLLPELLPMIRPRTGMLIGGLFLLAVNRSTGLVLPWSTKYLVDEVIGKHRFGQLTPLVLIVVGATLVQGVTTFVLAQVLGKEGQRLVAELRSQVQEHVGRLPIAFFDSNRTGVLVSRIMTDVEGIRAVLGTGLIELIGGVLTAAIALALMIAISPTLTGATAVGFGLFGAILHRTFRVVRPIFRERGKINAEVTGRLTESLGGVRVVKGYHAEASEAQVFAKGVGRLLSNALDSLTCVSLLGLGATVLMGLVGAVIMHMGARLIAAGSLTVGGFFTYTMLLGFLVAPVVRLVAVGTQLTEALAGLERTRELRQEMTEDVDPRRVVDLGPIRGEIVFEDVHFQYEPAREVVAGISFRAEPGTVTALVGPSGAGKSTIIGLLAAFHGPTSGRILVDGTDLSTARLRSYRTQLGVVLQETFLFDGTIRENVAFSRPSASQEELIHACRLARVDEFAEGFPSGYDTLVGERGVKLSGGQRQRVSIARAILAEPRILILDEATSSLDSESESMIQLGLAHLMKDRTTFVIAHRLSTIRRADQILVVENGRVSERGTHATLCVQGTRYFEMVTRQQGLAQDLFLAPGEGDWAGDGAHGDTSS